MRVAFVFLAAWVVGLGVYLGSLALFYRQSVSYGDLVAVVFWSFLAFAVAFVVLYLPALIAMRRWLHGVRPLWPFPLLGVLLGVAPIALIQFFLGGGLSSLMSPEAYLFYTMFAAVGVVVGLGYAFIYRRDRAL